jgi:serine/threonine-protein kinase
MKPDMTEEQFRLAVQMFERAIELDPNFALAFVWLSEALSILSHFGYDLTEENISKAKAAADRVLELQPGLPEGNVALGLYYYLCHKDYDRALEELAMAEKDLPNNSRILEYIGYIRRRQGNFEAAVDNLEKAFELNPQALNLLWELGKTYRGLRRYPEAERYYDRCISLAPDHPRPYTSKSSLYRSEGLLEKARATLEEMPRKTDPESINAWHINWIWQELFERNYQAALELLSSDFVESLVGWKAIWIGYVYWLMKEPELSHSSLDSARILLEKEVKELPDVYRTRRLLGIAYAGLGRKEEAIREGKLAVELYPVSKDAIRGPANVLYLALIYVMVGEYDAALDKIEYLLSIPCTLSVPLLRFEPQWDPLRDHPRFKRLLEEYSQDDS